MKPFQPATDNLDTLRRQAVLIAAALAATEAGERLGVEVQTEIIEDDGELSLVIVAGAVTPGEPACPR